MHSKTLSFIKSGLLLKKHFVIYKSFSIRQRRGGGSVTLTWEFIYMREEVGIRLVPRPVGDSCTGGGRAESPGDRRQCWYSLHPSVLLQLSTPLRQHLFQARAVLCLLPLGGVVGCSRRIRWFQSDRLCPPENQLQLPR